MRSYTRLFNTKLIDCLWRSHMNKNQYYFHWEAECFWVSGSVLIINIMLPCLDKILVLNSHIICFWFLELTVPKNSMNINSISVCSNAQHDMLSPTIAVFHKHSKMILMNNDPIFLYHISIPYCMLLKTVKPFTLPRSHLII